MQRPDGCSEVSALWHGSWRPLFFCTHYLERSTEKETEGQDSCCADDVVPYLSGGDHGDHFFSRESGSRHKGLDLEFLSTWGINDRNNAFVIENILLFIPFGVLCPMTFRGLRKFWRCLLVGMLTSLFVESLQLLTGRGYFQIDDILTNVLGAVAGYLLYFAVAQCQRGFRKMNGKS